MGRTKAHRSHRISQALYAACTAALLGATLPAAAEPKAEPPTSRAPDARSVPAEQSQAAPDAGTGSASDRWEDYSVEVYGMLVSRSGKLATLLPLVSTTKTPVAAGTKAVLFRRLQDPNSATSTQWVEIARVTMKKIDASGRMQLAIDSESRQPSSEGQLMNHFAKGARLKLAIE